MPLIALIANWCHVASGWLCKLSSLFQYKQVASKQPEVWFWPWPSHSMREPSWGILHVARICVPDVTFLSFSFHDFSDSSQRHPEYPLFPEGTMCQASALLSVEISDMAACNSVYWKVSVCSNMTLRARHCKQTDPNRASALKYRAVIWSTSPQCSVGHKGWTYGAVLVQCWQGQAAAGNASPEPGKLLWP